MHGALQFGDQRGMYPALAFHAADTFERRRHQPYMEMGFAMAAVIARRAGMAGMAGALVVHFQHQRRESGGQFFANCVGNSHKAELRLHGVKVKRYVSLSFTGSFPYLSDG